jgi:lysozyme
MRQPSQKAYTLIEGFESRKLVVYPDSGTPPVPTVGVGHTGRDVPPVGTKVTPEQVDAWFHADVAEAVATIYRHVPADVIADIPDVSYDALVSFVFNVGDQAFVDKSGKQTNFSKTLNAKLWDKVDDRMRDWVFDGGKKVNGLINRRAAESAQWNLGFEPSIAAIDKPELAAQAAAVAPATLMAPEVTGIVPSPPPKVSVFSLKGITGLGATAAGAITANADDLVSTGNQLRATVGDIKLLSILGGVLVAIGMCFLLWEKLHDRSKSGA